MLALAFRLTFGLVRLITYRIHSGTSGAFHDMTTKRGLHIHPMVPGMLLVLASGYLSLVLPNRRPTALLAVVFGIGAALVLDEFALWLRLADVYWAPRGGSALTRQCLPVGSASSACSGWVSGHTLLEAIVPWLLTLQ